MKQSVPTPELLVEWNKRRNKGIDPFNLPTTGDVMCRFSDQPKVWWKCKKCACEWQQSVFVRMKNAPVFKWDCPRCNSLSKLFPELARDFDRGENIKRAYEIRLFHDVHEGEFWSAYYGKFGWECNKGHWWRAKINDRLLGKRNCKYCRFRSSIQEVAITVEIAHVFKTIKPKRYFRIEGRDMMPDVFIDKYKVAIEFDGWYWHKNSVKRDTERTDMMIRNGFKVIRVREKLEKITKGDIVVPLLQETKKTVDTIFRTLVRRKIGTERQLEAMRKYIKQPKLKNQAAIEDFR